MNPSPYPQPGGGRDPGTIPLRPLRVGETISLGLRLVLRHAGLLVPLGILTAVLASAVEWGVLAATDTLDTFAQGQWAADLFSGGSATIPAAMYVSTGASMAVVLVGVFLLSGRAIAAVGADAVGGDRSVARGRLAGRMGVALAIALVVGLAVAGGLLLVVVPGLVLLTLWAAAVPVGVMERSTVAVSLRRSLDLTRGSRGRILGVTLLVMLLAYLLQLVVTVLLTSTAPTLDAVAALLVRDAVAAVVSGVTLPWVGAVLALLYFDIRVRREGLGEALRRSAVPPPGV